MEAKKYSRRLFTDENGMPLKFVMSPCDIKSQLKAIIETAGGMMSSKAHAESIRLAVPGRTVQEDGVISSAYICECVQQNKLLDKRKYRIARGETTPDDDFSSMDDDMEHASVIIRVEAKDRKGRSKYLLADDLKILRYLLDEHVYSEARGKKIWTDLESRGIIPGRTWQSMRDRYLKHILPEIKSFGLKPHEVARLTNTMATEGVSSNYQMKPNYRGFLQLQSDKNKKSTNSTTIGSNSKSRMTDSVNDGYESDASTRSTRSTRSKASGYKQPLTFTKKSINKNPGEKPITFGKVHRSESNATIKSHIDIASNTNSAETKTDVTNVRVINKKSNANSEETSEKHSSVNQRKYVLSMSPHNSITEPSDSELRKGKFKEMHVSCKNSNAENPGNNTALTNISTHNTVDRCDNKKTSDPTMNQHALSSFRSNRSPNKNSKFNRRRSFESKAPSESKTSPTSQFVKSTCTYRENYEKDIFQTVPIESHPPQKEFRERMKTNKPISHVSNENVDENVSYSRKDNGNSKTCQTSDFDKSTCTNRENYEKDVFQTIPIESNPPPKRLRERMKTNTQISHVPNDNDDENISNSRKDNRIMCHRKDSIGKVSPLRMIAPIQTQNTASSPNKKSRQTHLPIRMDISDKQMHDHRKDSVVSPFSSRTSSVDWDVTGMDDFDKFLLRDAKVVVSPLQASEVPFKLANDISKVLDQSHRLLTHSSTDKVNNCSSKSFHSHKDETTNCREGNSKTEIHTNKQFSSRLSNVDVMNSSNLGDSGTTKIKSPPMARSSSGVIPQSFCRGNLPQPEKITYSNDSLTTDTGKCHSGVETGPISSNAHGFKRKRNGLVQTKGSGSEKVETINGVGSNDDVNGSNEERFNKDNGSSRANYEINYERSAALHNKCKQMNIKSKSIHEHLCSSDRTRDRSEDKVMNYNPIQKKPMLDASRVSDNDSEVCTDIRGAKRKIFKDADDSDLASKVARPSSCQQNNRKAKTPIGNKVHTDNNQDGRRIGQTNDMESNESDRFINEEESELSNTTSTQRCVDNIISTAAGFVRAGGKKKSKSKQASSDTCRKIHDHPLQSLEQSPSRKSWVSDSEKESDVDQQSTPSRIVQPRFQHCDKEMENVLNHDPNKSSREQLLIKGQKGLRNFLVLETQQTQSQNASEVSMIEDKDGKHTEEQVEAAYNAMKELSEMYEVEMDYVLHLVYFSSGDLQHVQQYLRSRDEQDLVENETVKIWREADDEKLLHGAEDELSELERYYGEQAVSLRQQFLASYLRSRESA